MSLSDQNPACYVKLAFKWVSSTTDSQEVHSRLGAEIDRDPEQEWQSGSIADLTAERAPEEHEAETEARDKDLMEDLEPL